MNNGPTVLNSQKSPLWMAQQMDLDPRGEGSIRHVDDKDLGKNRSPKASV